MKKEILPSPPQQPKKHEGLGGKFVVVVAAIACWLPSCASYGSDMWFYKTMRTSGAEGLKLQIEQHRKKSAERAQG